MKKCSVDLVAGFLSSGKSSFINLYLKNMGNKEEIVVIQCEQGKKNIDDKKIILKTLQSNEELTEDRFLRIIKFYFPSKIIIECNGVGDILTIIEFLNNKKIKQYVRLDLVISLIDCSTFNMFLKNISSIMLPYIKISNLIILNKCNLVSKEIVEKNKETLEDLNLNAHINICNTENDLSKIFKKNTILRLGKVLM